MVMDDAWVAEVRAGLPELPAARRARYVESGLDVDLAGVLSDSAQELRDLYEEAVTTGTTPRSAANWLTGEVTAWLRRTETEPSGLSLTGRQLAELVAIVEDGTVSSSAAKDVLQGVLDGEGDPRAVAASRDLVQISDTSALSEAVAQALADNPDAIESYKAGETKVIGFLVGQVMRATQGRADPQLVNEMLREKLGSLS
jgi:aspartyl-tRNA(Asn)/glutamyl-tRNA(Gln) amidotransferase subunit B